MCLMSFQSLLKTEIYRLGIRLVFLWSLLDSLSDLKIPFDIRCDIGKLVFMRPLFSLVFLMSLIKTTF